MHIRRVDPSQEYRLDLLSRKRQHGTALVIILSAIVLISVLVGVFISQATLNRQISSSSAGSYRAEIVAQTGIDTVLGDLRDEIVAGSIVHTVGDVKIYQPVTNFTVVPSRIGDMGYPNVFKRSVGGLSFWAGPGFSASGPVRAATGNSATNISANGRFVKAERWNAPYLLGTNLPVGFASPDWVLIGRRGAFTNMATPPSLAALSDPVAGNTNFVTGRFTYMIYNEGGLLDATIAGFPSTMDAVFKAKKGLMPQVDLALIPGVLNANAIVQWRNKVTSQSVGTYSNYVFGATNGFITVAPGDQNFVSRQDFINYAKAHSAEISTEALQYLGTASFEVNGPTYFPDVARPKIQLSSSGAYAKDDLYNPSLVNTRVVAPFLRFSDGKTAEIGESLIKYRFPLSSLALLSRDAVGDQESSIYKFFGLTRNSPDEPWTYRTGANKILTLSEVAALSVPREPDFFELLQAGILVGSLGQYNAQDFSKTQPFDANIYYQVIQIGANLIDQYDANSYPTILSFNGTEFAGIESLPYISRVFTIGYRYQSGAGDASAYFPRIGSWYQPEVWNPHVGAQTLSADGPSRFRFRTVTDVQPGDPPSDKVALRTVYSEFDFSDGLARQYFSPWIDPEVTSPGITFEGGSAGYDFSNPIIPSPAKGAAALGANDHVIDGGNDFLGICAGIVTNAPLKPGDESLIKSTTVGPSHRGTVTHELQYWDGSRWITYNWMRYILQSSSANSQTAYQDDHKFSPLHAGYPLIAYNGHSDPRSGRFGSWMSNFTVDGTMVPSGTPTRYDNNKTIRPTAAMGDTQSKSATLAPGWNITGDASIGYLSENLPTSSTHYADPDGVVRPGDGMNVSGSTLQGGYPLGTDASSKNFSRPVMLNRPFRSVSEMAYASRGIPWKHLDFFSKDSGDAALLDLFSVNTQTPQVQSGRIDLNTRQIPVVQAILSGAFLESNTSGTLITLTSTEAKNLATSLVNLTSGSSGPLLNRADLVTRWMPIISGDFSSAINGIVKRRRESAIRAFGDMGNTRTWNVMIDIIAQSGRYGPKATSLDQFTVEGERRFWMHAAIDRYTGKIVSTYIEPVYE